MKKTKILDAGIIFIIAVILILFVTAPLVKVLGVYGMALAELLMVFAPVTVVLLRKESIRERFNLRLPSIRSFFSAALLMMGVNMWENAATFVYVSRFGMPEQNDVDFLQAFFADVSPIVALVVIALVPAVCEELLFRGYLFDSFKGKRNKVWAVLIPALMFSAAHFDAYKLAPLLIMGIAMGYITARTGSVLLPIIFHFLNNAMSLVSFYELSNQDITSVVAMDMDSEGYLWYALAAFGIGLIFVYFGTRLLSGKPRKKVFNILVPILSAVLATVGIIGLIASTVSIPYVRSYKNAISEETSFTESFSIEEDTFGVISVSVMSSADSACSVTVTDPKGEEIYNSADSPSGVGIDMEKGDYKVTYSFGYTENSNKVRFYVKADVTVVTVGVYEKQQKSA
ncbi:MAG: CPBP family intramembrane metalloprotease [Clostridia bacterium]|nr:CPBP family intramembrane metalloprotease [Clostridia bacterium]